MGDARIHWSLRIGRRIRERLADDQAVPLGRWALRWVHSRLGEDLYLLDEACDDQALASAGRVGLVPSSADVTEAGVALEAWDLFTERWVSPAWGRQLSPKRVMTGYLAYLAALEAGGLVQRTEAREPGVDCLPGEVQEIDDRVSKGVADWFVDLPLPDLVWTAYADRVTAPLQRQQAGSLVAACSAATGRVVPASVAAVIELFENDWQDTVASLLGNPSVGQDAWKFAAGDDRAEDPRRTALPEHVRSLVVSSLVEQGAAVREHDWLMGSLPSIAPGHDAAHRRGDRSAGRAPGTAVPCARCSPWPTPCRGAGLVGSRRHGAPRVAGAGDPGHPARPAEVSGRRSHRSARRS